LKRGNTVVIQDVETDERTRNSASLLLDIGIRVMINLPIIEHRKFVLVVFIHYDRLRRLTPDELDFVRSVGDRTQAAIARVRAEEQQKNRQSRTWPPSEKLLRHGPGDRQSDTSLDG
jgi:GAF domain-containing protein